MAAAFCLVDLQVAPVPADAARTVALRDIGLGVERAFDRPVVRQVELAPVGVVVAGGRGAAGVAGLGVVVGRLMADDLRKRDVAEVERWRRGKCAR
jgi:hypothetical protein